MSEQEQGRYRWVRRMAWAELVASALMMLVSIKFRLDNLDSDEMSAAFVLPGFVVVVGMVVAVVGSGLTFVHWVRQCIRHEGWLDPQGYRNKPVDIIWAYVIPFINLIRPYEILKRLADVSDPDSLPARPARDIDAVDYRDTPRAEARDSEAWRRALPLKAWWLMTVFTMIARRIDQKLPDPPVDAESADSFVVLAFVTGVIAVVQSALFLRVIDGLQARRQERLQRLHDLAIEKAG